MFTFSVLDWKQPFWANLIQNMKIVHLKLKFATLTYSNLRNSMVVFTFSVLYQKHPFRANLVQKIKIVSLG